MTQNNDKKNKFKLFSIISVIAFAYLFSLSYLYIYNAKTILSNQINSYGHSLSKTISLSCIEDILSWNFPELNSKIKQIGDSDDQLLRIDVTHKHKIIASYNAPAYDPGSFSQANHSVVKFYSPISHYIKSVNKKEYLGVVEIYISQQQNQEFLIKEQMKLLFVSSSLLLIVVMVIYFVFRIYTDSRNLRDEQGE